MPPSNVNGTKPFMIGYEETYTKLDQELDVHAQHPDHVKILDVTRVGDELRWRYVIVWEST